MPAGCPLHAAPAVKEMLRRHDQEAEHGVCDTGRYRCQFSCWGKGPPLLLMPGMGADARSFVPLMLHLIDHFRCVAYDLPGEEGDGARLGNYGHSDYVADALALLDHLRIDQAYVLGVSFGSTIALASLRHSPDRLVRAVLQGGFACRPLAPAEVLLARLLRPWRIRAGKVPFRNRLLKHCHFAAFARHPEMWDFFLQQAGKFPASVLAQRALLLHQVDLRPILHEIRQPILLVSGDADPLVGGNRTEELLKGLPNAGLVRLANCGHYAQFTHAAELADLVTHFLTPPEAPRACLGRGATEKCP